MGTNLGKLIINILKLENAVYWLQSKILPTTYKKEYKKFMCPDCWRAGHCLECGCDIDSMFESSKPCPRGRFGSKYEAIIIRGFLYGIIIGTMLKLIF